MDAENTPSSSAPGIQGAAPPPVSTDSGLAVSTGAAMPLGSALYDAGLKSHQGLAKFKDVDALAKSYVELDAMRRERSGVSPLSAESTPEQIAAYRVAFGIPEKPEGYETGELPYPADATPSEADMAEFKGLAHSLHLTPAQVQGILDWHAGNTSKQWNSIDEARQAQNNATKDHLIKRYGAEAGNYAQLAHDFVKREYGDEGLEALDFNGRDPSSVGSSPVLLDILIQAARLKGHDVFRGGGSMGGLMSKDMAQQKIAELRAQARDKKISDQEYNRQFEDLAKIAFGT